MYLCTYLWTYYGIYVLIKNNSIITINHAVGTYNIYAQNNKIIVCKLKAKQRICVLGYRSKESLERDQEFPFNWLDRKKYVFSSI